MRKVLFLLLIIPACLCADQYTWEVYTGATAPGSTTVPAIKNALKSTMSSNSGASAPSYVMKGMWWYDTTDDTLKMYNGSSWITVGDFTSASWLSISGLTTDEITASTAAGVSIIGYEGDADLLQVADASIERWAITTDASADTITMTWTDNEGTGTLTFDHGETQAFKFNHALQFGPGISYSSGSLQVSGTLDVVDGPIYTIQDLYVDKSGTGSQARIYFSGALADGDGKDDEALAIRADNTSGVYDRFSFWGSTAADDDSVEMMELATGQVRFGSASTASYTMYFQDSGATGSLAWASGVTPRYQFSDSVGVTGDIEASVAVQAGTVLRAKDNAYVGYTGTGSDAYVSFAGYEGVAANNDRCRVQVCQSDGDIGQATSNVGLKFVGPATPGTGAASVSMGWVTTSWFVPPTAAADPSVYTTPEGAVYYNTTAHKHYGWNGSSWTAMY